jgi:hypothetical protein
MKTAAIVPPFSFAARMPRQAALKNEGSVNIFLQPFPCVEMVKGAFFCAS